MNIKQLSAKIDKKLAELDVQIKTAQKNLSQNPESEADINAELARLEQLKQKLKQSKDIAWRAHELQSGSERKKLRKQHFFAIFLIGFSLVGLVAIAAVILFS